MVFNTLNSFIKNKVIQNNKFHLWLFIGLTFFVITAALQNNNFLQNISVQDPSPEREEIYDWPFEPLPYKSLTLKKITEKSEDEIVQVAVKSGENLSFIFQRLQLSSADLLKILSINGDATKLKSLKPNQKLRFEISNKKLQKLVVEINALESLIFSRKNNSFTMAKKVLKLSTTISTARTKLKTSLYIDGKNIGLTDSIIMQLTTIFAWDIDFSQEIRINDSFKIIYEKLEANGKYYKMGRILAAEFVTQGKKYTAILNVDDTGKISYFSEKGNALQKAFLRNPVDSVRVSSRFNLKRKHPILNRIRAHKGVDYAAPTGTPIRATADGQVKFLGVKGGYGKTIELKHGGKYTTLYAHLSAYNKGLKVRTTIKQGQVIGYVGKSGLATGAHLHYEFRVNGQHRNPLTVKLPAERPINAIYKKSFEKRARLLMSLLNSNDDAFDLVENKKNKEAVTRLYSKR